MVGFERRLVHALVAASLAWPLLLATTVWPGVDGAGPAWRPFVLLASSRICHRQPDRSFQTAGLQWPVCGRCSGLYLAAPLGALGALFVPVRRPRRRSTLLWLSVASIPTVLTLGAEWMGLAPVTNLARLLAALPLGAAVAFVIVRVAGGGRDAIGYTQRP